MQIENITPPAIIKVKIHIAIVALKPPFFSEVALKNH